MNRKLLYDLLGTVSVSGSEEANQEIALSYARDFADRQFTDAVGNAVSVVNPEADCRVLPTDSSWFGVTYREDKPFVVESIRRLVESGEYPVNLFAV